jgi:hypothetical protein
MKRFDFCRRLCLLIVVVGRREMMRVHVATNVIMHDWWVNVALEENGQTLTGDMPSIHSWQTTPAHQQPL